MAIIPESPVIKDRANLPARDGNDCNRQATLAAKMHAFRLFAAFRRRLSLSHCESGIFEHPILPQVIEFVTKKRFGPFENVTSPKI